MPRESDLRKPLRGSHDGYLLPGPAHHRQLPRGSSQSGKPGEDAGTTAAVTGGLAGLLHGWNTIPGHWVHQLARRNHIEELARRLAARIIP